MASKKWDRVKIQTEVGEVDAVAPVIISASRSTDIPAFFSDWFMNRLQEGYVKWINPFNGKSQYVSFNQTRLIVFWTKDAGPMLPYLSRLNEENINYYFTFTLNDYENEGFEPGLRSLKDRIETFKSLSKKIGKENVIWRFDPLILTNEIDVLLLLDKIKNVGDELNDYTDKLVISFAEIDRYRKVKKNLKAKKIYYQKFNPTKIYEIAAGLQSINKDWGLEVATCSVEQDLIEYNIRRNKCIDDELILKNFSHDSNLLSFLGLQPFTENQLTVETKYLREKAYKRIKDKGQRKNCGCIISKDIGQYDTCKHQCLYCYANISPEVAVNNYRKYLNSGKNNESIL